MKRIDADSAINDLSAMKDKALALGKDMCAEAIDAFIAWLSERPPA